MKVMRRFGATMDFGATVDFAHECIEFCFV
jgi:hypothetical protein